MLSVRCALQFTGDFGSKVPDNFEDLLKLPGVGRKSANLIMGDVFGKPAIVTDTHCIRLCNRIGLSIMRKIRKRWRWLCGKLYRQKKEAIFATV